MLLLLPDTSPKQHPCPDGPVHSKDVACTLHLQIDVMSADCGRKEVILRTQCTGHVTVPRLSHELPQRLLFSMLNTLTSLKFLKGHAHLLSR